MTATPARGFPWLREHRTMAEVQETERLIADLGQVTTTHRRAKAARLIALVENVPCGCVNYPTYPTPIPDDGEVA